MVRPLGLAVAILALWVVVGCDSWVTFTEGTPSGAGTAAGSPTRGSDAASEPVQPTASPAGESPAPSATQTDPSNGPEATPAQPSARALRVANTNGDGVYLRRAPGQGEPLRVLAEGTVVVAMGPSQPADGRLWQQVQAPGGEIGWIAADFLVPNDEPVRAIATPTAPTTAQRPDATPTGSAIPTPSVALVGNTGGVGVYVRRTPVMSDRLIAWPDNTVLEILGDETWSDGRSWRLVRDPAGNVGWVPSAYLVFADSTPSGGSANRSDEAVYTFSHRWSGRISYCINAALTPAPFQADEFVAAVRQAFAVWQAAAGGTIPLDDRGICSADPTDLRDGQNTIGWGDIAEAGVTSVRFFRQRIFEADIVLNNTLARRRDASACVAFVLTHEVGHFLGLDHASPRVRSVMRPGARGCPTLTELPEDDVRNIRSLYSGGG